MSGPQHDHREKMRSRHELEQENALFYQEIMVARRASDITASLVVEQFKKMEEILHQLEDNLTTQHELRKQLAEKLQEVEEQKHKLAQARNAAEAANAAKSAFLASTSHELRTPLTSVLGFARIIQKRFEQVIVPAIGDKDHKIERATRQINDNLGIIVEEGERLTKLINNVLDLAKIESGRIEWKIEPVSIAEVIERSAAATTSLFQDKPVFLELDLADDLPPLTGDRDRLVQVVINLIANGVKFTQEGSVTCQARRENDEIVVRVIDTGIGIAEADHQHVFENFTQVTTDTLADKPSGTGLGLAICKQIIEHHHGRIWVESELGKGSVFAFTLPTRSEMAGQPAPAMRSAAAKRELDQESDRGKGKTLLIVDDEANIRELIRQELAPQGYRLLCADNGEAALRVAEKNRPDLILLDLMLPGINGYEVLAELRKRPASKQTPIIIVSILEDKEKGYASGADSYFTKPINAQALLTEIENLLGTARQRKTDQTPVDGP